MMRQLLLLSITVFASIYAATSEQTTTSWLKKKNTVLTASRQSIRKWNHDPVRSQFDVLVVASSKAKQIQQQQEHHDGSLLSRSSARWMLVLCAFMYGTTYPLTKLLQESIHPSMVTALRFNIAALFFIPQLPHIVTNQPTMELMWRSVELGVWCSIGFIR